MIIIINNSNDNDFKKNIWQPVATLAPAPPSTASPSSPLCEFLKPPFVDIESGLISIFPSSGGAAEPPPLPSAAAHPPPLSPDSPFHHSTNLATSTYHPPPTPPSLSIWCTPTISLLCIWSLRSRLSYISGLPLSSWIPSLFRFGCSGLITKSFPVWLFFGP